MTGIPIDEYAQISPRPDRLSDVDYIREHSGPVDVDSTKHGGDPIYPHNPLPPTKCSSTERYYDLEVLLARIDTLGELPDNWDSYGAKAPGGRSRREAKEILTRIFDALGYRATAFEMTGIEVIVGPMPDGVDLQWSKSPERGGATLCVLVTDSGEHRWMIVENQRLTTRGEIPDDVAAWTNEVLWGFCQAQAPGSQALATPDYGTSCG